MQQQAPLSVEEGSHKKEKKTGSVAFILSVLFHGGILLMIGGIVLIPAVVQKSAFTADPNMMVPTDIQMDEPPNASQDQNDLPPSQAPQENMQLSETPTPAAQNDLFVAREDTSGAASSWAGLAASTPVDIKTPKFDKKENDADAPQKERKMSVGSKITLFGSTEPVEGDGLAGTFYDLKRTRGGTFIEASKTPDYYADALKKFTDGNWNTDNLKKYWFAPNNLYLQQIAIPTMPADEAPKAFDVKAAPSKWIILYRGYVTPPKTGEWRFLGGADDVLIVRFNTKIALDASIQERYFTSWPESKKPRERGGQGIQGDWVRMDKGVPYPIEIIIGENPGGNFNANLRIERKAGADKTEVFMFSAVPNMSKELQAKVGEMKVAYFRVVKGPN